MSWSRRREHLTHEEADRSISSWCERCRKVRHLAKAGARRARRQTPAGHKLHIYRCPGEQPGWHIGTLPAPVRRGEISKDDWYGRWTG